MRSDRVMRKPVPVPWISPPQGGRPPKHGKEFRFAKPETWGESDAATTQVTDRYGTAQVMAWDRIHPRLTTRSAWIDHEGELPILEGTLIRLEVDHLPGGQDPLPVWLWSSKTGMTSEGVDLRWQAFPRRFDIENPPTWNPQVAGAGVSRWCGTRADRGCLPVLKIVCQEATSVRVSTSRARSSVVA